MACTGASPNWTTTPDYASVNNCVGNATNGDTINLSAGNETWTSVLTINKNIELVGVPCTANPTTGRPDDCTTIIRDNVNSDSRLIAFTLVAGGTKHGLKNIKFIDGGRTANSDEGIIWFSGSSWANNDKIHIQDCIFEDLNGRFIRVYDTEGLINRNTIIQNTVAKIVLHVSGAQYASGGVYGDAQWAAATDWGGDKFLFFENNGISAGDLLIAGTDGESGGRYVFRFNDTVGFAHNTHGTDSTGRARGIRAVEVYNNTITGKSDGSYSSVYHNRSGPVLIFNNVYSNFDSGYNPSFGLIPYRRFAVFSPWEMASGESVWDVNDPNSPFDPGSPCTGGASGRECTANSGAGVTVTVSGANWTENQWQGYTIRKTSACTGNCASEIISNTQTEILYNGAGSFGADLAFANGETFEINKVTHALDSPGRSGGSLISGAIPTPPVGWNDQITDPCYEWNNSHADYGGGYYHFQHPAFVNPSMVRENEHYYNYTLYASFNGSAGTSMGTRSQMDAITTCTEGVLFWVTDEGSWNQSGLGGQGRAYRCGTSNNWQLYYTPYQYPHPMASLGIEEPPSRTVIVFG